ncbi:MAG: hypothetical protein ACLFP8_01570 [Alphaproteobacteria bacterium]
MDSDIQVRLKETSQNCLDAYLAWKDKKLDSKAQEQLHGAIHELRKVSSRLEIELAMSERDQLSSKPLPIPSHRSNMKAAEGNLMDDLENNGKESKKPTVETKTKRRRAPRRKTGGNEDNNNN